MKSRTTSEIRSMFLSYFKNLDHQVIESSSLIPKNDPSLLFVNAGMVPFKDVFLGRDKRAYDKAVSSQACLRVGGKHNDFNQVGFTSRHHTYFEMLGNFSFGAYFKLDAIKMAWTFITEHLDIPVDRLWVSVHYQDDETYALWHDVIGIPENRISRCGDEDNYWSMGDVGPCGPCTEIFYDLGSEYEGGPPGSEDQDGQRYMEIWNVVFMQYDRSVDGTLTPLAAPCVDTGMGLERISAVLQGVSDTFDIDIFKNMIAVITASSALKLQTHVKKILADHARASIMLIADGITPGAVGRAYVLRRLIRRALRFAYTSGIHLPCLSSWVDPLVELLSPMRSDLILKKEHIKSVLLTEELQFEKTLRNGIALLDEVLKSAEKGSCIDGSIAFKLYDTFGFPLDVTEDILSERGFTLDINQFNEDMAKQKLKSKSENNFKAMPKEQALDHPKTKFIGYEFQSCQSTIIGLYQLKDSRWLPLEVLDPSVTDAYMIVDESVFYAEGGGQVGDKGMIESPEFKCMVEDTQVNLGIYIHKVKPESGQCRVGDRAKLMVDQCRMKIRQHHSATHLLHAALHAVLGKDALQKGSWVDDKRLRFDFSAPSALSQLQLAEIEAWVNDRISEDLEVLTHSLPYQEAIARGAIGLFEDNYQDLVRVVSMGEMSKELCGGTHVRRTSDLSGFTITSTSAVSSGVRRIEALAGGAMIERYKYLDQLRKDLVKNLKCDENSIIDTVMLLKSSNLNLKKQAESLLYDGYVAEFNKMLESTDADRVIVMQPDLDPSGLLKLSDYAKSKHSTWVVLLGMSSGEATPIICANIHATDQDSEAFAMKLREIAPLKAGVKRGLIRGVMQEDLKLKQLLAL